MVGGDSRAAPASSCRPQRLERGGGTRPSRRCRAAPARSPRCVPGAHQLGGSGARHPSADPHPRMRNLEIQPRARRLRQTAPGKYRGGVGLERILVIAEPACRDRRGRATVSARRPAPARSAEIAASCSMMASIGARTSRSYRSRRRRNHSRSLLRLSERRNAIERDREWTRRRRATIRSHSTKTRAPASATPVDRAWPRR